MNRKRLIIVGASTLVILVVFGLIWWWLHRTPVAEPVPPVVPNAIIPAVIPPASEARLAQESSYPLGLRQLAFSFAERYGSYSSDEPTKNLEDLRPLMTPEFQAQNEAFVRQREAEAGAGAFEGMSTVARASTLGTVSATEATVTVNTQRTRTAGNPPSESIFYQNLILTFRNVNGQWLVNSAGWR